MKFRTFSTLTLLALLLVSIVPLAAQDTAECEDGFRLVDHELLATDPVCIPENPERVVALSGQELDLLLATGSQPVGAIGYLEAIYTRTFPYMLEGTGFVYVGFPADLESILELDPDIIIGNPFLHLEIYDQLQAIAPTVISQPIPNVEWETSMRFLGDVFNLNEEVNTLLAEYDARVETLRDLIGDPSETEISVVRYYDDTGQVGLQLQLANAFSTDILADVGFARPESQAYTAEEATEVYGNPVAATLSLEQLPLIDGQYLFAWSQGANDDMNTANAEAWELLREDLLWATLGAVQSEQTFQVGGHWVGWGFPAAHAVLDDLFIYIAGVDPAEVSPNPFLVTEPIPEATEEASD